MRILDDLQVAQALRWPEVLAALSEAFSHPGRFRAAARAALPAPQGGSFLTMPCADQEGHFGVKQVSVLPDNARRGLPSVQAHYTLFGPDGGPALSCAATILTRVRTAAVSALAAAALAPPDARRLLVVGSGALAPWMAEGHLQVRPYQLVAFWGRSPEKASRAGRSLSSRLPAAARPAITVAADLRKAVAEADVISVATTAMEPIVRGGWLEERHHLDLVGAFNHAMAEADAEAVARSDVFVDSEAAARAEAGDLIRAAGAGWSFDAVQGDLSRLLELGFARRGRPTLFKSVGLALEDLAVARLLL